MTMTTFHFQTHVSDGGVMTLPSLPETFYGEDVIVKIDKNPKQQCDSFLGVCAQITVGNFPQMC